MSDDPPPDPPSSSVVPWGSVASSMFGSSSEVSMFGGGAPGTGFGSAMIGGASGFILDKMITGNVGAKHHKILDVVKNMVVASGNGASDDRLLGMVERFGSQPVISSH